MSYKIFNALIILSSIFIFYGPVQGETHDPWVFDRQFVEKSTEIVKDSNPPSPAAEIFIEVVKFFREYISPVDGDRCMMYPSCTGYSIEAVRKHGFFVGYIMTIDRLIHENNEMDLAPLRGTGDAARFYDPVENNDFWWYKELNISKQ